MSKKNKALVLGVVSFAALIAAFLALKNANIPLLQPAGEIGQKERNLMYTALLLAVIVVVPVFVMLFTFVWRYREGNEKAKYSPEFSSSRKLESIWWGIPCAIIFVLSIITWNSSHALDPFRPISAAVPPMQIQVIALQFKWLFIYPDKNVASVNYVQFPVNTPVDFEITSDAPMNSFWIPQLGGQIYAMSGMSTHLHLIAGKAGDYAGRSANISGTGFAHMTFTARASSTQDFNNWVNSLSQANNALTLDSYSKLAQPGIENSPIYYSSADSGLYNTVMDKYLGPQGASGHSHGASN